MKKIVVTAFFEGKKKDGGSCSDSIRFIYDESIEALPALLESPSLLPDKKQWRPRSSPLSIDTRLRSW